MGDIASSVFWVIVLITILVFVHEMGHFLAARLFGMRIDRFSIGFPPTFFKKKIGETEWAIGATPLGGYVKIAGMVDESLDTEFENTEPQPWEFRSKPVWQRVIVISAGVTFNLILAAVIFAGIKLTVGETMPVTTEDGLVYVPDSTIAALEVGLRTGDRILSIDGKPFSSIQRGHGLPDLSEPLLAFLVQRDGQEIALSAPKDILPKSRAANDGGVFGLGIYNWPAILGQVQQSGPAFEAGLRPGDRITTVDGDSIELWLELTSRVQAADGKTLLMSWYRPTTGETFTRDVTPESSDDDTYRIGVEIAQMHERYNPGEAVAAGIADTWNFTGAIVISLKNVITGRESVRESLGGPVMVAKIAGEAAQAGTKEFWRLVALLSITLAIVNILPVPALDGGHLVFLIYEGIRRREPPLKVRTAMQQAGMLLIMALMAFLVFNDLDRIFRVFQ